jgi:hypothetical protein
MKIKVSYIIIVNTMSDSNQFLPVFVATGVAVLGCAAAFYFSDSDSSMKRRKTYPIHTKDFDDDIDSYDEDYNESVKQRKKKHLKMGGGRDEEVYEEDDDEEEEDDEDEDEEDEEDEEDDVEEDDEEEDDEDRESYLVNKRVKTPKSKKQGRR